MGRALGDALTHSEFGSFSSLVVAHVSETPFFFGFDSQVQQECRWRSSLCLGRVSASQTRTVSDGAAQRSYVVLAPPPETHTEAEDGEQAQATAQHNRGAADMSECAQRIAAYNDAALLVSERCDYTHPISCWPNLTRKNIGKHLRRPTQEHSQEPKP
jgi:hypothetical protein